MIRVIEHGFKYRMEACCVNCGCRFTYEWEDVLKDSFYSYNQDGLSYMAYPNYYLLCPECTARVIVPYLKNPFQDIIPKVTWNGNGFTISTTTKDSNEED